MYYNMIITERRVNIVLFITGMFCVLINILPLWFNNWNPGGYLSLVTSCSALQEEEPQTAHLMSFTRAFHIAANTLTGRYPINQLAKTHGVSEQETIPVRYTTYIAMQIRQRYV